MGTRLDTLRMFLHEKEDPEPFYARLAEQAVADLPYPVDGRRVLDLGCGAGYYTRELRRAGAEVHPVDLDPAELSAADGPPPGQVLADGGRLPFVDGAFDGVFCSNMLEHTPDTRAVFTEMERILRPRGWAWVSWTNWYSPWGGHEISPLHYLGPRMGLAAHRRLRGEPRKNLPGEGLFPVHIGRTLTLVRSTSFRVVRVLPRYYPSQRWIMKVPGLREVAAWNCLLLLERA